MSVISCILAKASLGKVTKNAAEKIKQHVEFLQASVKDGAGSLSELKAAQKALADGTYTLQQKQGNITRSLGAQKTMVTSMEASMATGKTPFESFQALFYGSPKTKHSFRKGVSENIAASAEEFSINAIENYKAKSFNALRKLRRNEVTGGIDQTLDKEVFHGLFELERTGKVSTGSKEARQAAQEVFELGTFGAREYRRLGGSLNIRQDILTGFHTSPDILRSLSAIDAGFEDKFIQHVMKLGVDVDHFNKTFGAKIQTRADLESIVRDVYKSILSGGPIDRSGKLIPANMKHVATANNIPRALRFTTPEASYEFMKTYGSGNMAELLNNYSTMRGIEDGSRAAFGPSPRATRLAVLDHIKQVAPEDHQKASRLFDRYAADLGIFNASSALSDARLSYATTNVKNGFYAALLGRMGLWQMMVDMWNLPMLANNLKGLPIIENISQSYKALFRAKSITDATRVDLARRGFVINSIADDMSNHLLTAADQGITHKATAYGSHGANAAVKKFTGGTRSVNATIDGSLEFMVSKLSGIVESGNIDAHGADMGNWLKSLGFDEKTVKFLKENALSTAHFDEHPFTTLDKTLLNSIDTDEARAASLALTRVLNDHRIAVNPVAPGPYRAALKEAKTAGKIQKAGAESLAALTSYLSGYVHNMLRMSAEMPGKSGKMKVLAQYLTMSVVAAYEASVINNLLAGKDAPEMSADLLAKVLGRSMGPIGDALVSGGDSFNGNVLGSLLPGANFVTDVLAKTQQLGLHAVTGEFQKLPADASRLLTKALPGQSAPIFGLLLRRYFTDQIIAQLDPDAVRKFRSREKTMRSKTGTSSYWKPGELTPTRAPDFSKMLSLHINESKN